MNLFFKLCYLIGFTPWDRSASPAEIRALVEGETALKPGRAIDLGCGPGRESIFLAKHGWQVTGVDGESIAIGIARKRAADAGAVVTWVHGDVTRLRDAKVTGPFDLLIDSGCFHGMSDAERARYCDSITGVAAPDAQLLLLALGRAGGRRGPRGANREDIESALGGRWEITWSGPADEKEVDRRPPGNPVAMFFRLRRRHA